MATWNCSVRVSWSRTGWPVATAASAVSTSLWPEVLRPKPPPTVIDTTRTWFGSRPNTALSSLRTTNGACVDVHTETPPSGSGRAIETDVSSGAWWTPAIDQRPLTTWADAARAASGSPTATLVSVAMLGCDGPPAAPATAAPCDSVSSSDSVFALSTMGAP